MLDFERIFFVTAVAGGDDAANVGKVIGAFVAAIVALILLVGGIVAGITGIVHAIEGPSAEQTQIQKDRAECYKEQAAGQAPGADCSLIGQYGN